MAFLNFEITPRGKISQKRHLFCPEFRENPNHSKEIKLQDRITASKWDRSSEFSRSATSFSTQRLFLKHRKRI